MELFEELRREYELGVGSIAGVARKFGVYRRLVREAVGCAIPQEGELEQIQFLLGHRSVETTERYLGSRQRLVQAVNDHLGIEPPGSS